MNLSGAWKSVLWFALGLVVAGAVMAVWLFPRAHDADVTIRSYDVNPGIARELRGALASALWTGQDQRPLGQVTLSPNGRLLVTGPESVQEGVQRVIREVSSREIPPTPSMLFEAWIVTASPAGAAQGTGDASVDPERLKEIEPALAAIRKTRGPMHFALVEKLATQARSGNEDSEVRGGRAQMRVTPTIRLGEKDAPVVSAVFHIEFIRARDETPGFIQQRQIKSMAELKPGQLLVVGQSSGVGGPDIAPGSDVYYIVRASL
jgi:hypothetical protein